jgi:hypothetical protein
MDDSWQELADTIAEQFPAGPRVAVLGSASLHHPDTESTCEEVGRLLADIPGIILLTGGVGGVGATVGKSYYRQRRSTGKPDRVFHILPEGSRPPNYGRTFIAGDDMHDRREVLARLSYVYLVLEGGPGTAHETSVAGARDVILIPVGRSGGHAADLYESITCPACVAADDWRELGHELSEPRKVAKSLADVTTAAILEQLIRPARLLRQGVLTPLDAWAQITACLPDEELSAFLSLLTPKHRRPLHEICESSDLRSDDGSSDNSRECLTDDKKYNELVTFLRLQNDP